MRRIGFFVRSPKLTGRWSLSETAVALSGTDAAVLFVLRTVLDSDSLQPLIIGTNPPVEAGVECRDARSLPEAYETARKAGVASLLFTGCSIEELRTMRLLPVDGPQLVMWAHNSPTFEWLCAAYHLKQSFRVVAVSDYQCYEFNGHPIYSRVVAIPNPAPEEALWAEPSDQAQPRRHICYIGALKASKGFHHLAAIWPAFRKLHPELSLVVCGSSSLYDVAARCGAAGLSDDGYERLILAQLGGSLDSARDLGVVFRGSLAKRELREVVRTSLFAVVNPNLRSSTETFCCSAVEAQCFGVPVVGASAGALRETVGHEAGGLLFQRERDLLPTMLRLTDDARLRATLARKGYERVTAAYRRDKVSARWVQFLGGHPISRFAGSIQEWATLGDHARIMQRLLPLPVAGALRQVKRRLRRTK